MKPGRMVHVIAIERGTQSVDAYGTPAHVWSRHATLRAELIERSTEEFLRGAGETDVTSIAFRTRYLADLTNSDRINFDGQIFDIEEITPIGRARGLEIRCIASEAS